MGIEINDEVDIRYSESSSSSWWGGFVSGLRTSINGGMTIECVGYKEKLREVFPAGRYGNIVTLPNAGRDEDDVIITNWLSYLYSGTGGYLSANTYAYAVSAVNNDGETLSLSIVESGYSNPVVLTETGKIDLTWTAVDGARYYRVYRQPTGASGYEYWETTAVTWTDDGSLAGEPIGSLPAANTTVVPTNSPTTTEFVDSVLTYLVNTYAPAEISIGEISAGSTTALDDYDLTENSANLYDIISALADIVGNVLWGVDSAGELYFIADGEQKLAEKYRVGRTSKSTIAGTGQIQQYNLVMNAQRSLKRDAVDAVRVQGEEQLSTTSNVAAIRSGSSINGRNVATRYLPGVTTGALANTAAANFQSKYSKNPDTWTLTIKNIVNPIIPAFHTIRLTSQFGDKYELEVQTVSYNFDETPDITITAGDREMLEDQRAAEELKSLQKAALRSNPDTEITNFKNGHQEGRWKEYLGL
jgi:hypothetical protein